MARKVLHVAEKPSVAKELANILSRNAAAGGRYATHTGPSVYNKIFEFQGVLDGGAATMLITSVTGHLMETDFDERFRKWNSCDPVELFEAPIIAKVPDDKADLRRNLEQAARQCQELVLWLDCDREGEAIGFEVIEVCLAVNRRLRVRRARFSALIPRDIEHALANLVAPYERQAHAVQARSEIDLRLGAAFTRMQTLALQNRFEGINGTLSYGPCQFPTMWFVAQRAERIAAFVPEDFWHLELSHTKTDEAGQEQCARFSWSRSRLYDRLSCLVIYEMCVERRVATVASVVAKEARRYRPTPLATVEMQRQVGGAPSTREPRATR